MTSEIHQSSPPPPLIGKRVYLRPVGPNDYEFLYALFTDADVTFKWRLRGATPSPERFSAGLWENQMVQFMIMRRKDNARVGLISVYNVDLRNGHGCLAMAIAPPYQSGVYAHDANLLFLNYLLRGWNLRKLYGESGEQSMATVMGGEDKYFKIEGRLRDHEYFDGRYWDTYTLALYREDWEALIAERLPRVLEPGPTIHATESSAFDS